MTVALFVHPYRCAATVSGLDIELTRLEHALLRYLIDNEGRIVPRAVLMRDVWGGELTSRVVDVAVARLRKKVPDAPIIGAHGVGYGWVPVMPA